MPLIRLTARVFHGRLVKFRMCPSFSFGIEVGMWDVIVLIPDHCPSIYFTYGLVGMYPYFCQ